MSFFKNKLLHRKTSRRKIAKSQLKYESFSSDAITLKLGDIKTTFEKGEWIAHSGCRDGTVTDKENTSLKIQVDKLKEENNLLKLKYEILLDMLVQKSINQECSTHCLSSESFFSNTCNNENKS